MLYNFKYVLKKNVHTYVHFFPFPVHVLISLYRAREFSVQLSYRFVDYFRRRFLICLFVVACEGAETSIYLQKTKKTVFAKVFAENNKKICLRKVQVFCRLQLHPRFRLQPT